MASSDKVWIANSFRCLPLSHKKHLSVPPQTFGQFPINFSTETSLGAAVLSSDDSWVDCQSDDMQYGRGDRHLSADLNEGDLVVYRTGSWYVDGVLVGDYDASPSYELCRIETIQVVWTHNCEHGVLRGVVANLDNNNSHGNLNNSNELQENTTPTNVVSLVSPLEDVEFGPEQLVARIRNVEWTFSADNPNDNSELEIGICPIPLDCTMWKDLDANGNSDTV